ncbi:hypothetical protein PG985_001726 [Apiospora marii]|uniref:Ankyrin repeat domain-containing protein n=1 Tax=Apiospora marii TaxID=335849 RepID=A0ABR1T2T3_9PEZI
MDIGGALMMCTLGRLSIVRLLLDHGADSDAEDPAPIAAVVARERLNLARLLRQHGARSP